MKDAALGRRGADMDAGHIDFQVIGPQDDRKRQPDRRKYAGAALVLAALFVMDRGAPAPLPRVGPGPRGGNAGKTGTPNGTGNTGGPPPRTPVAHVVVTPREINFPDVVLGAASPAQRVTFENDGEAAGSLGQITLSDSMNFRFALITCTDSQIAVHAKCYGEARFRPAMEGAAVSVLNRPGSDPVQLFGTGDPKPVVVAKPAAQFEQRMSSYGVVSTDDSLTKVAVLRNTGTVAISDLRFRLEGDHIEDFSPFIPDCNPLALSNTCGVRVTFLANHVGTHQVWLVASSSGVELDRTELDGTVRPRPVPTADLAPNPVEFNNRQRTQTVFVRNFGEGELKIDQITVDNRENFSPDPSQCLRMSPLARGETCPVPITFTGKKSATRRLTVLDNDPTRSQHVGLAANVSKDGVKKFMLGLAAAGFVSYEIASHTGVDKKQAPTVENTPPETKSPPPNNYRRQLNQPQQKDVIR